MNESGPAICGRSARPHHRKIICDEDLVTEDATVLTVLWIHARVVTYAVCQQLETTAIFLFYFLADLTFWFEGFSVRILWELGSGGEIISARWEFLRRLARVCHSLVVRLNDARHQTVG